ncbi:hypothetical protein J6590_031857 [Homalodisca vitripennis]|nr:hypothetical protein J6590_031857 [Homalodisca vitripennis]
MELPGLVNYVRLQKHCNQLTHVCAVYVVQYAVIGDGEGKGKGKGRRPPTPEECEIYICPRSLEESTGGSQYENRESPRKALQRFNLQPVDLVFRCCTATKDVAAEWFSAAEDLSNGKRIKITVVEVEAVMVMQMSLN